MASSKELKLNSKIKRIIIKFLDFLGYELKRKNNKRKWGKKLNTMFEVLMVIF